MQHKQVVLHENARAAIQHGVDLLARTVRTTLGPKGRNVAISHANGLPSITPDGVTVAQSIDLPDPVENVGAQLLKEAAKKTNDVAGDGTTTSTILAQALVDGGLLLVAAGANPMMLKRGFDKAVHVLDDAIKEQSRNVETHAEIAHIATISSQDPELGEMVATIMDRAGRDSVITIEEGQGTTLDYAMVEGLAFDRGWISTYFVTDTLTMEAILDDPAVLICPSKISTAAQIVPVLELLLQSGKQELAIIAEDVTNDALATLVVNGLRGTVKPLAVKAPGFGDHRKELLEDIAVMTGGTVIDEELGLALDHITLDQLGYARRIRSTSDETTIIEGKGDKAALQARIAQLRTQAEMTSSTYDRDMLEGRIAKLAGGVAVIKIGAPTEPELEERKARADDALHAIRAALSGGTVPGGGVAYLNLIPALDKVEADSEEEHMALNLLKKALEEPTRQIAANAGFEGAVIVDVIRRRQQELGSQTIGFDALRAEYGDLLVMGIIDPAKVVRAALENAISVAGMLLTTDAVITDVATTEQEGEAIY